MGLKSRIINIDVFLGGAPLLERKLCVGLLEFGATHPRWRFSMRGADFRYTKRWLRERPLDGVLALIDPHAVARGLDSAKLPWVHLLPGQAVDRLSVRVDDLMIGKKAAEFFLEKGFLRTAFCGVGTPWSKVRHRGFSERIAASGRPCIAADIPFVDGYDWGFSSASEDTLRSWVATLEPGTAVMAAHDALANRLVDLCIQEGLRVPQDVAILGVGNHDLLCKLSPVAISSIDAAVPQVAIEGAKMLESMIIGGHAPQSVVIAPGAIHERRSSEILAYGDDLVARMVATIRDHASSGITVEDLLASFPISRRTLSRRFAKYVGHSPAAEIRLARLRRAENLLHETTLGLTEIASTCGYTDLSHMNRAFQKFYAKSPSALRGKA